MNTRRSKVWFVTVTAGAPRARALAQALRRAREATGMSVRELARVLGVSHATVSQWETSKRVPDPESVAAFLQAVGVTGDRREEIMEVARGASDPSWLASGIPGASPGLSGVLECERTTTEIVEWSPLVIPGLCQSKAYARAIFDNDDALSPSQIDALVAARANRQSILTNNRDDMGPANYSAMIGEYALRETIGGRDVQLEQLRILREIADLPTVTIRIVPRNIGWHPGLVGPFILYYFDGSNSIIHIEHFSSSAFLYENTDVDRYKTASSVVRRKALSPSGSLALIDRVVTEMESERE